MQNTDTYDRANKTTEPEQHSKSLLSEVMKGLFFLVAYCAILNLPFFIAPEKISYWDSVVLIGIQVTLWVLGIFAVLVAYSDKKHRNRWK